MSVTAGDGRQQNRLDAANPEAIVDYATGSHGRAAALLLVVSLLSLPAGLLQHPAGRPRRGALRPGHQADGRDAATTSTSASRTRFATRSRSASTGCRRRWSKPPRLLGVPRGAHAHLALSDSVADRRDRRGAADLLGGARLRARGASPCWPALMMASSLPARRRGAAGQDRRHAAVHRASRRWARWRAPICRTGAATLDAAERWTLAGDLLDRAGRRHPAQGAADPDVRRRLTVADAGRSSTARRAGCCALQAAAPASPGCCAPGAAVVRRHRLRVRATASSPMSVGGDMLGKVASGQESHGAPPGLLLAAVLGDVLAGRDAGGAGGAGGLARARANPARKFLLAWLVPSWIVFELVMTKLPHYVLPLYPAIAILIAGVVGEPQRCRAPAGWSAGVSLVPAAAARRHRRDRGADPDSAGSSDCLAWPFGAAAVICGLFAWWLYRGRRRRSARCCAAITASILVAIAMYGVVLPSLPRLFPSVELARALRDAGCREPRRRPPAFRSRAWCSLTGTDAAWPTAPAPPNSWRRGCRFALVEAAPGDALSRSAPMPSACAITPARGSSGINLGTASRSPSRSSARKASP